MRALVVALLVLAAPPLARAELDAKGVRAGTNMMSLEDVQQTSFLANPGLTLGAFLTWRFARAFALQGELLFSAKRLDREQCEPCMVVGNLDLYFLELPFLARVDLLPGTDTKLHFDVGPELVLPLGAAISEGDTSTPIEDLNPINFGLVLGAGLEFGAGPGRLTFDVRYQRWLIPIAADPDSTGDTDVVSSHQLVLIGGYAFP